MKVLLVFLILSALVLFYIWHGRDWLKSKPWAEGFFRWIEPIEIALWQKSRTMLLARYLQVVGIVVPALQFLGAIDFTPILTVIPERYRVWLMGLIAIVGFLQQFLRNRTSLPVELVAVPDKKAPPEVKAAIVQAEVAAIDAVATVEIAKEERKI